MSSQSFPRADGLRAMREAKFEMNQRRMKEEEGKTVTKATKKKAAKNIRKQPQAGSICFVPDWKSAI